ncbi:MAG: hypothetical protein C5S48_09185 [Candidatus Methanogaster sp.]|nr:MAG: hypothetical protein C5S48_09185 [ANME-2 cluster archaeon]
MIMEIEYFGHYNYEDGDLDVIVYVDGIDERKGIMAAEMRLFDRFLETDLNVPLRIAIAKERVGEEAAA